MSFRRNVAMATAASLVAIGAAGGAYYEYVYKPNHVPFLLQPVGELPPPLPINGETVVCMADVAEGACNAQTALGRAATCPITEVAYKDISPALVSTVIASEDRKFRQHDGVDMKRFTVAVGRDVSGIGRFQGASTVDMQVAKIAYPAPTRDQITGELIAAFGNEDLARKYRQQRMALRLDLDKLAEHHGDKQAAKDDILTMYLNRAYLGRGICGVENAARVYYGKHAKDLNYEESATIIGLEPNPSSMDISPVGAVNKWTAADAENEAANMYQGYLRVINALRKTGAISQVEFNRLRYETDRRGNPKRDKDGTLIAHYPSVLDYRSGQDASPSRKSQLGARQVYDDITIEATKILGVKSIAELPPGYHIYTTIDSRYQAALHDAIQENNKVRTIKGLGAAGVLVAKNGSILAEVGGPEGDEFNAASGRATIPQPAGSGLKPFVWLTALEHGWTLDKEIPIKDEVVIPKANNGRDWHVKNSGECQHAGLPPHCHMSFKDGLGYSSNDMAAEVVKAFGPEAVADVMRRAGLTVNDANASIVLGTNGTYPLELANANRTIANDGQYSPTYLIEKITDPQGNVVYQHEIPTPEPRFDPEVTRQVREAMGTVVTIGTAKGTMDFRRGKRSIVGKTGTDGNDSTNKNRRAWMTAISCDPGQQDVIGSIVLGNFNGNQSLPIFSSDAARIVGNAFRRIPNSSQTCELY